MSFYKQTKAVAEPKPGFAVNALEDRSTIFYAVIARRQLQQQLEDQVQEVQPLFDFNWR